VAILGAVGITLILYSLLSVALTVMVTPDDLMACVTDYGKVIVAPYNTSAYGNCRVPETTECSNLTPSAFPAYVQSFPYAFYLRGTFGLFVFSL